MRVHDSQAYRKMAVRREHHSLIMELREILLSFKSSFNLVKAAVVCRYPGEYLRLGTLVRYNSRNTRRNDCCEICQAAQ